MSSTLYIVIIVSLAIVGGLYYWQKRRVSKKETADEPGEEKAETKGDIFCRIADNITARIYNAYITQEQKDKIIKEFKTLGRQWFREGKRVYALNKYEEQIGGNMVEKLRPIMIPTQITNAPSELHNDMQQPEIAIIMTELMKDEDKPFIEKYGQILWWIAIMSFLAFMWSQS